MNLFTLTDAQNKAQQIDGIAKLAVSNVANSLYRIYEMIEPEVVEALGTSAAQALAAYQTFHAALLFVDPTSAVPSLSPDSFVINEDGSARLIVAAPTTTEETQP